MGYKKTFRYSTGNPIVDEVGTMNFTGNVIPMVWFKTIRYPNGAPHNNAIHILADICQRRFKIVRKRRPNFVVSRRGHAATSSVSLLK